MSKRRAFSVVEVLVSIVVLTIVAGGIAEGMRRQQQVFRSIALMIRARADVRDAAEVLASDLSSASPLDTVHLAADSAVEFLGAIAHSVSCDSSPGYSLHLPPEKTASRRRLTTLLATPDTGDVVLLYSEDSSTADAGRWDRHTIAAVASGQTGTACPASTGFTAVSDAALPSTVITLGRAASSAVRAGAPVRILRRVRYSLYRSSDSKWHLGQRRCAAHAPSSCGTIQPLAGPYASYAAGGLSLRYFDSDHAILSPASATSRTARIAITARVRLSALARPGRALAGPYVDSAASVVALRNRD